MDEALKKKLSRLEAQCVKREYCVRDIMAKALKAAEGNQAEADELVASLRADKFVDDARYAAAFAREKSSLTGWGPVKIRFALRAKGLSETNIAAGLAEIDSSRAEERLERLTAAKWKSLQDDPQGKLKLIRFALSRGYDYDAVQAAISKLDI